MEIYGMIFEIIYIFFYPIISIIFFRLMILTIRKLRQVSSKKYFKDNVVVLNNYNAKNNKFSSSKNNGIYKDISKEKLSTFNTESLDAFKDYLYGIFYKFEQSYNNLDYSSMKLLCTKQLFQNYYTGISLDLKLGNKRIIESIERRKVILYEIDSTIAKQSASLMIEISYINYVVNQYGEIVSGYRETPIVERFEVEFRKYFDVHDVIKCKNCGAIITGNKCDYCRTIAQNEEFKISSIRKIIEKK